MEIERAWIYWFDPKPVENSEVQCPECLEYSSVWAWRETEVPCEICGSHSALVCPRCNEVFDEIGGPKLITRIKGEDGKGLDRE